MKKVQAQQTPAQRKVLVGKADAAATMQCRAISIGQVILDESNYLTFWGYIQGDGGWRRCDFITNYDVLNEMLRHSGHMNDAIQMSIVQHLEDMRQVPEVIDLEASHGEAVVFDNMRFQLSRPRLQQQGRWIEYTEGECYYITKVTPEPARETVAHEQQIDQCMALLGKSYELYLGYLELDFEETVARQEANLTDDLKYTMAYYAWKQHHH
ncbi:hypothetical protein [Chitinophaga japonensis]|uniref:Uncharacterized protein n=1 Tax=Chitinophaga japonensis TaxID=104662 RepID=A0A562TFD1_CHIJA|nr:hypothetical protein [Chitinophaga japonensis]TWI92232.1 hypothetical protein LX66_1617 [Chitinophaga japonensis]